MGDPSLSLRIRLWLTPRDRELITIKKILLTLAVAGYYAFSGAIVFAADLFPPACVLPLGWSTPAGATRGWIVATDSASEGTCSLKSDAISNSGKAQVQFRANFGAGNVIFDRSISSEYFFDCLKFFIDGVQQNLGMSCASGGQAVSGTRGWGTAIFPITSGVHTLTWSYEKDSSSNVGADAAWIDDVELPVVPFGSAPVITSAPPPNAIYFAPYSHAIASSGAPSATYLVTSGSLPPGLALNGDSGVIAGTPLGTGVHSGIITASNINGSTQQPFDIFVSYEDFPPHCALAPGWSASGWHVTMDDAGEGLCSMKTDPLGPGPAIAQLTFQGTMDFGYIEFKARVSSELGRDCLRFFIDGVDQQIGAPCGAGAGLSGEIGWSFFSVYVEPGQHDLVWSYEKDATNSAGMDAAWLDAIVIPPEPPCQTDCTGFPPPRFDSAPPPDGAVNVPYRHQYVATSRPQYELVDGAFPAGISLDPLSGLLAGTPTQSGVFTGAVRAINGGGFDIQNFNITVGLSDEFAFAAVWAGNLHSCGRTAVNGLKCWGDNQFAALGDGSTSNRPYPYPVTGLTNGVAGATAGLAHSCALTTVGGLLCWGANGSGQLGDGSTTTRLVPVDVSGILTGALAISAGDSHTCAVTAGGAVKCWGSNSNGQLGDNSTTQRSAPADVSGLSSGVIAVAAGTAHTCAVTSAGAVKCWGSNSNGQLGDNSTAQRLAPVQALGLTSGVASIFAGGNHTCAVTTAGAAKCWGSNANGEVGDNSTTQRLVPTDVSTLSSGVAAITTGARHTCARTTGGAAKCWGSNDSGQIGDGTGANRRTPRDVLNLSTGVIGISAGGSHSCATLSSGFVQCWGLNSTGQLGDGTTVNHNTPAPAVFPNVPGAPSIQNVTSGNGQVQVSFSQPDDGGAPILRFTAVAEWEYRSETFGSTKSGLLHSPINFTIPDGSDFAITLAATNAAGTGPASAVTGHAGSIPGAPKVLSIETLGDGTCESPLGGRLVFAPPSSPGTSPITSYVVRSSTGETIAITSASPVSLSGINPDTVYTFTVSALNASGEGPPSQPSDEFSFPTIACAPAPGSGSSVSIFSAADGTMELAYSTQLVGTQSSTQSVVFKDSGAYDLLTGAMTRPPMPPQAVSADGAFELAANDCSPDSFEGTCSIAVRFQPTSIGPHFGTLTIVDAAGNAYFMDLSGYGVSPPGVPVQVTATAGDRVATIVFPDVGNGGSSPVLYTVTSTPGGKTASGDFAPIVVQGLSNGTQYTFSVTASNQYGYGLPSEPSNAVTPFGSLSQLSVNRAGEGSVVSNPPGIFCGASCNAAFSSATSVSLSASPAAGYSFAGWSGCDSTQGAVCSVSVMASRNVTASFASVSLPVTFTGAFSRKTHGAAGNLDLAIDASQAVNGAVTVEPRAAGTGHRMVFRFSGPITSPGTAACVDGNLAPIADATVAALGDEIIVTLPPVPDATRARVTLANVNGSVGAVAAMGFLRGDANGSRTVTASDILRAKGRVGQAANGATVIYDLDLSGFVDAADVAAAKQGAGRVLQ
jgi:alpha-tubulin suppressor-like RCC1 family protein